MRTTPLKCWDSALIGEGVAGATKDKTAEVPQAQAEDTVGANKPARNLLSEGHGSFLGSPLPPKEGGDDGTYSAVMRFQQFSARERLRTDGAFLVH